MVNINPRINLGRGIFIPPSTSSIPNYNPANQYNSYYNTPRVYGFGYGYTYAPNYGYYNPFLQEQYYQSQLPRYSYPYYNYNYNNYFPYNDSISNPYMNENNSYWNWSGVNNFGYGYSPVDQLTRIMDGIPINIPFNSGPSQLLPLLNIMDGIPMNIPFNNRPSQLEPLLNIMDGIHLTPSTGGINYIQPMLDIMDGGVNTPYNNLNQLNVLENFNLATNLVAMKLIPNNNTGNTEISNPSFLGLG